MNISGQQSVQSAELVQFLSLFMAQSNSRVKKTQGDRDALDVRSAIFTDLRTKLTALKRIATDFSSSGALSPFAARTATVSNDAILAVSVTTAASKLSHAVHVDQLAQAHSVLSDQLSASGTTLAGTMVGTKTFTVAVDDHQFVVSVNITAGQTNKSIMESVATAINSVTGSSARAAAIADSDTTTRLSLTSGDTGSAHGMHFTDTSGLLGAMGLTNTTAAGATAGGYLHADLGNHELDAKLTVDGIQITRSTNVLTDVISGATLTLKAAQAVSDAAVSVKVGVNTASIKTKVQGFLDAYNAVASYLTSKTAVDRNTLERGALAGDYGYTTLAQKIRVGLAGDVSTASNPDMIALAQVGITSDRAGVFTISDASKFDAALDGKLDSLASLFDSTNGIGKRLERELDSYTRSGGVLASSSDGVQIQKKMLDARIKQLGHLQDLERDRLTQQYGAIQEASAMQQSMSSMLGVLASMTAF